MRLGVEPAALAGAADHVRDLAAQVGALDARSVGSLVSSGMPDTVSARLAAELSDRLAEALARVAADLTEHAQRLRLAAVEYAATDSAVQWAVNEIGDAL